MPRPLGRWPPIARLMALCNPKRRRGAPRKKLTGNQRANLDYRLRAIEIRSIRSRIGMGYKRGRVAPWPEASRGEREERLHHDDHTSGLLESTCLPQCDSKTSVAEQAKNCGKTKKGSKRAFGSPTRPPSWWNPYVQIGGQRDVGTACEQHVSPSIHRA